MSVKSKSVDFSLHKFYTYSIYVFREFAMIKKLPTRQLKAGMIALEDITTPLGQDIVPAGTELTRQIINRMKLYSVESALVEVPNNVIDLMLTESDSSASTSSTPKTVYIPVPTPAPEPAPVPVPAPEPAPAVIEEPIAKEPVADMRNTRIQEIKPNSQKIIESNEFMNFQIQYLSTINDLKEVFENVLNNKGYRINEQSLANSIASLVVSRNTITELFDMLYQMHSLDDSIYAHCVNVALIARMIGRWLHLDSHELNILTCCGLFHDIGKLSISAEVLNKPGKLTNEEFAMIKAHPKYGYELLRNQDIDNRIKQSALMHHERYDGSGYPNGLSSELLIDYAMIIAIADVYDAMTAARSYREPLCPFQVIANFEKEGFQKYHTKFLLVFLNNIASTYQSNRVMLNDGRACKIVMLNNNYLSRPIIQFDNGECLDLSTNKELYISKVL